MCRWLAYVGTPLRLEELLYKPAHSLIDQSLHAQLAPSTTNGDGVGVGWWSDAPLPGLYRSIEPAWGDKNLRELAAQVTARAFLAHVRASTGSAVQQTNCHPFRHRQWLWMHNGEIAGFHGLRRELMLAIDPALFSEVVGTTDSEVFFFLALTMGLERDPPGAVARAAGLIEHVGRAHGLAHPLRMTLAVGNGARLWAFRYASDGPPATLFHSEGVHTLRAQFPTNPLLHQLSDESRLIVSEPFAGLLGAWREVPVSSWIVVGGGPDELQPFSPAA